MVDILGEEQIRARCGKKRALQRKTSAKYYLVYCLGDVFVVEGGVEALLVMDPSRGTILLDLSTCIINIDGYE